MTEKDIRARAQVAGFRLRRDDCSQRYDLSVIGEAPTSDGTDVEIMSQVSLAEAAAYTFGDQ